MTTPTAGIMSPALSDDRRATRNRRPHVPRLLARLLSYLKREAEAHDVQEWKRHFRRCGTNVEISPRCSIWGFAGLQIGDNSCIHQFTHIFASGGVEIGRNVMISSNCAISSVTHPLAAVERRSRQLIMKPVTIGD